MESPPLGSPERSRYEAGHLETPPAPRRLSMSILCPSTPSESSCSIASIDIDNSRFSTPSRPICDRNAFTSPRALRNESYTNKVDESIQISPLCSPAYKDRSVTFEERANCAFLLTPEGSASAEIENANNSVLATPPRVARVHANSPGRTNNSSPMGFGNINGSDWSPSPSTNNSYRGSPLLKQRYSRLTIGPGPGSPLKKSRVPLRDLKQFEAAPLRKSFSNPSLSRIHQDSIFASTPVSNQPIKRHIFNGTRMLSPVPGISNSSTPGSSPLKSCLSRTRTPPSKRLQRSVRFDVQVGLPFKIPHHCKPKIAKCFGLSSFDEYKEKYPVVNKSSDRTNRSKSSLPSHRDNILRRFK